jgi:hypothetical protein
MPSSTTSTVLPAIGARARPEVRTPAPLDLLELARDLGAQP